MTRRLTAGHLAAWENTHRARKSIHEFWMFSFHSKIENRSHAPDSITKRWSIFNSKTHSDDFNYCACSRERPTHRAASNMFMGHSDLTSSRLWIFWSSSSMRCALITSFITISFALLHIFLHIQSSIEAPRKHLSSHRIH